MNSEPSISTRIEGWVDAATVAQQHDQQRWREREAECEGGRKTRADLKFLEQLVEDCGAGCDRQPRQQRERHDMRERQHVDEPWHRHSERVGERMHAARMGRHPFIERLIAADPGFMAHDRVDEHHRAQAQQPDPTAGGRRARIVPRVSDARSRADAGGASVAVLARATSDGKLVQRSRNPLAL